MLETQTHNEMVHENFLHFQQGNSSSVISLLPRRVGNMFLCSSVTSMGTESHKSKT